MVQNYAKRCSDNTKDPDQNRDQQRTFSLSDTVHLWAGDEETPETQNRQICIHITGNISLFKDSLEYNVMLRDM